MRSDTAAIPTTTSGIYQNYIIFFKPAKWILVLKEDEIGKREKDTQVRCKWS
jgi:hypothetical protein